MRSHHPKRPRWPKSLPPLFDKPFIRRQRISPSETRQTEKLYLDARKRFYAMPLFRENICDLRRRYDEQYWRQAAKWQRLTNQLDKELKKDVWKLLDRFWTKAGDAPVAPSITFKAGGRLRFNIEAEALCQEFGLEAQDWRWVEWLVRHWDPSTSETPSLEDEPYEIRPNLFPWRIVVTDYLTNGSGSNRRRVTLVLEHGASEKAARSAAARAVKDLPAVSHDGGRPTLMESERERLCELFQEHGFSKKRAREADFRTLANVMEKENRNISLSTIRKEYFRWAEPWGIRPRQYEGAHSRDRRP